MTTRLIATLIIVVGLGAIVWTSVRSDDPASTATITTNAAAETESTATTSSTTTAAPTVATPESLGPRKDLEGLDGWLNTEIESLDELDGKVIMVEMWTFGCSNCKARIPHTQELYATYEDRGFEIVGVHAPEFDYEADISNIEQAIVDLGVTWPVALDTRKINFRSWQEGGRRFWPRTFLIDQSGEVRYDHIGEGDYDGLEQTVAWLLDNPPT